MRAGCESTRSHPHTHPRPRRYRSHQFAISINIRDCPPDHHPINLAHARQDPSLLRDGDKLEVHPSLELMPVLTAAPSVRSPSATTQPSPSINPHPGALGVTDQGAWHDKAASTVVRACSCRRHRNGHCARPGLRRGRAAAGGNGLSPALDIADDQRPSPWRMTLENHAPRSPSDSERWMPSWVYGI